MTSLEEKIWGFKENNKGSWKTTNIGDFLAFYVTFPIKKVVGYGKVKKKYTSQKIVWPDEEIFQKCIWPYKLSFNIIYRCNNFDEGISLPKGTILQTSRRKIPFEDFFQLIKKSDIQWGTNLHKEFH